MNFNKIEELVIDYTKRYNLNLKTYNRNKELYRTYFKERKYHMIANDFFRHLSIETRVRIRKKNLGKKTLGRVRIPNRNDESIFQPEEFKNHCFVISISPRVYHSYEIFISVLIHELSHIVLFVTNHPEQDCEKATDIFVMTYGLYEHYYKIYPKGYTNHDYLSDEEIAYVYYYIVFLKRVRSGIFYRIYNYFKNRRFFKRRFVCFVMKL